MIPLFKEDIDVDQFDALERKMVRTLALHNELNKLLKAEYEAGKAVDRKTLEKLTLRKKNCVNRLEHLVRTISGQLKEMGDGDLPSTVPKTMPNRVRAIPGIDPEHEAVLIPLAQALEQGHRELVREARKNTVLFKGVLDQLWAASKYANQGKMR